MKFKTIITVDQFIQFQAHDKPLIIDVRHQLTDTNWGRKAYLQNHIPNAFFLHMDEHLSGTKTGKNGRHPLPDLDQLEQKLQSIGLNKHQQVIVYDDASGMMASRMWWLLRYLGHTQVAILEGGFSAYCAQNLQVMAAFSDQKTAFKRGNFVKKVHPEMLVEIAWLEAHLVMADIQIIDARAEARFKGLEEPMDPVAGHILGAINRPSTHNQDARYRFKSARKLRDEWNTLLEDSAGKILIHSCGSGITACHNLLACEIAGIHDTKLYAGSWSEYCSEPSRKMVLA